MPPRIANSSTQSPTRRNHNLFAMGFRYGVDSKHAWCEGNGRAKWGLLLYFLPLLQHNPTTPKFLAGFNVQGRWAATRAATGNL